MKRIVLDLCCGKGGWAKGFLAEGWRVIGVDLKDFSRVYPGEFVQADLLTWRGWQKIGARAVVASPPCEEFSRHDMPWTKSKNPPAPDLRLVNRSFAIAGLLGVPIILENVRGAQPWLGRSTMNSGPFHLWGNVPTLCPVFSGKPKQSYGSQQRAERAVIPFELAVWVARSIVVSGTLALRRTTRIKPFAQGWQKRSISIHN